MRCSRVWQNDEDINYVKKQDEAYGYDVDPSTELDYDELKEEFKFYNDTLPIVSYAIFYKKMERELMIRHSFGRHDLVLRGDLPTIRCQRWRSFRAIFEGDIVSGKPTPKSLYVISVRQLCLCRVVRTQPFFDY